MYEIKYIINIFNVLSYAVGPFGGVKDINKINEDINKIKDSNNIKFNFSPNENELKEELEKIKSFGIIMKINFGFVDSNIIKNDLNHQNCIVNWIKEKTKKDEIEIKLQ